MKEGSQSKGDELKVFIFLTVFLAPIISIAIIGGYGFCVWMLQLLMGPPGV